MRIQPREIKIPSDDPFENDLLDRRESIEVLTHLVDSFEGPCALAVNAAWGNGKTTFLKIWEQHLLNHEFPVITFNAWETDFSGEPFVALSSELTGGLQKYSENSLAEKIEKTKEAAKEIIRRIAPGLVQAVAASVLGVAPPLTEGIIKTLASYAEDKLSAYEEAKRSIEMFRTTLKDTAKELSRQKKHPLIVMIDELDRCRPSYAIELLEVAKHLFAVNHLVFVLAINRNQLGHSIRALYGSELDSEDYFRRFFDIDFQLPEPKRDLFINASFEAVGVPDYFQRTRERETWNYEDVLTFAQTFLGSSDISLRRIAQAAHRLGLVLASLHNDKHLTAMTAVVALILRTVNPDLYYKFIQSEATDEQIVDAMFSRPEAKNIQWEKKNVLFEAVIIMAAHEILDPTGQSEINSPLDKKYKELVKEETGDRLLDQPNLKHAQKVVELVEHFSERSKYGGCLGFKHSVQCLELLSDDLIEESSEQI